MVKRVDQGLETKGGTNRENRLSKTKPMDEQGSKGNRQVLKSELPIKIEAVAFDMDGLLLNTEDLYEEVTHALLAKRGKVFKEEVRRRMIGLPAPKAYQVLIESESLEETWEQLHLETELVFERMLEERLETMPGVQRIFEAINQRGLPRCVATSSTRGFAHKALARVGILEHLDFVVTAEEVTRGKPYPDIYVEAAKRMQSPIERMLVLEDSETGTKAGVSAGAYVISVPNRHTIQGSFHGAKWIAESLLDDRIYELFQ